MFEIAPDHLIGLFAGIAVVPVALYVLNQRRAVAPSTVLGASILMAVTGAVHIGLVPTHLDQPVTAALFVMNGVAFLALSQAFAWRWWRLASVALIVATQFAYLVYVVVGLESPDQLAIATKLIELLALGLVLVPTIDDRAWRRTRWTALAAVPVLTMLTTATVWIDALARPDAQHAHAGALLQKTNDVATPQQEVAAHQLYGRVVAAIEPYRDWRKAWAAGYRPGGPQTLPSTHWMNQRFIDAGYVMDPRHPQGLVYANTRRGPELLGAMFQMQHVGQFGPDPGGPLTAWHQHENICFTPLGVEFSLMTPTATCPLGSIDISVPPMLHVWTVDNPSGRFAVDIDDRLVKKIDQT